MGVAVGFGNPLGVRVGAGMRVIGMPRSGRAIRRILPAAKSPIRTPVKSKSHGFKGNSLLVMD